MRSRPVLVRPAADGRGAFRLNRVAVCLMPPAEVRGASCSAADLSAGAGIRREPANAERQMGQGALARFAELVSRFCGYNCPFAGPQTPGFGFSRLSFSRAGLESMRSIYASL